MPKDLHLPLDATDEALIKLLQENGRTSLAELGRLVSLSTSATADRLRRITEVGIITGYAATVSPEALGYSIAAFIRLAYPSGNYRPLHNLLGETPEVIEAHHRAPGLARVDYNQRGLLQPLTEASYSAC